MDTPDHVPPFLTDRHAQFHPQIYPTDAVTEAATRIIRRDAAELKGLVPEIDFDLWPSCRDGFEQQPKP